jgi:hypothetical protein
LGKRRATGVVIIAAGALMIVRARNAA